MYQIIQIACKGKVVCFRPTEFRCRCVGLLLRRCWLLVIRFKPQTADQDSFGWIIHQGNFASIARPFFRVTWRRRRITIRHGRSNTRNWDSGICGELAPRMTFSRSRENLKMTLQKQNCQSIARKPKRSS